jgi:glycosyltransferase involved in cell wall biosynthesis
MTVLHLISLKGMGGRAATAMRQARLLAAHGHKVIVGCLPGTWAEQRARELGLEVESCFQFRRGFRPGAFYRDCRLLSDCCVKHSVQIVHAHVSQESWVACLGIRTVRPRPVLIRSRGVVVPIQPHIFNRCMHNQLTQRVITPSRVIYENLRSLPGFDPEKVCLIPDGVDLTRFSPDADGSSIRKEFQIPEGAPLLLMVARLERVKGHEIFFGALAKLAREGKVPGLRALCACDERTPGALDAAIRQAREMGCAAELLAFTGMRPDIERIFAAADVVALPSLGSEGSSRVALESGASGLPVVASSVGCLPEVIEDQITGRIVPPGNPDELAAALLPLLLDRELSKRLGHAARARVEKFYDECKMVESLEKVYSDELAKQKNSV